MALSRVELRRILRKPDALPRLRLYAYPEPTPDPPERPQLRLWVIDAAGLPARPWRIPPDARFECVALRCRGMTVAACVARQQASDAQRTLQSSRGQGRDFPLCDSRTCAQGRGIREALDPNAGLTWRGAGTGWRARVRPERSGRERSAQDAARAKAEREGRLEPVRVLDVDEDPREEG